MFCLLKTIHSAYCYNLIRIPVLSGWADYLISIIFFENTASPAFSL